MKFKSATEKMSKVNVQLIDASTKEFFDITFDISAGANSADIEEYAEEKSKKERGHICKALEIAIIETHDYTYKIDWDKFLENATVWKIDGVVVK